MAQKSKKIQIAEAALPLFLNNGIKGTSVDMVVRASGVSKPTVYNHFPDKATLLNFVFEIWLQQQSPFTLTAVDKAKLEDEIKANWLTKEALLWYGLMMGEGYRAPLTVSCFIENFDTPWRQALGQWASKHSHCNEELQALVSHRIISARLYCSQSDHD